jgi:hypothetical protein
MQALRLFGIELACAGQFTEPVPRGREVSVALGLKAGQRIRNFTEQIRNGRPLLEARSSTPSTISTKKSQVKCPTTSPARAF